MPHNKSIIRRALLFCLFIITPMQVLFALGNDIAYHRPDLQTRIAMRRLRVAKLVLAVLNDRLISAKRETDSSPMFQAIEKLGDYKAPESTQALVMRLDYEALNLRPSTTVDPYADFPAVGALSQIGKPVIPFVIDAIAEKRSETFTNNGLVVLDNVTRPNTNRMFIGILNQYANEYAQQAIRQRALVDLFPKVSAKPKLKPAAAPLETKPTATKTEAKPEDEKAAIEQLARIFELEALIADETLTKADETKVIAAIKELGKLNALRSVGLLYDKLDWRWEPAKPDPDGVAYPMTVAPKGLRTAEIAAAAKAALKQLGAEALPAVVDAASLRGRSVAFYQATPRVLSELAGGSEQARALMLQAADADDKKTQRLRDIAKAIPKVN